MSRKPRSNPGRSRPRTSSRRPCVQERHALLFDSLERRELLAGNLPYHLIDSGVEVYSSSSGHTVDLLGTTTADSEAVADFFGSGDGSARPTTFSGTMAVGGETVKGSFTLSERSAQGGIDVQVGAASLTFGAGVGIELQSALGAFELLTSGPAGVLSAGGSADSVKVSGLPGLGLTTTGGGLSFEVNETGAPVDDTVGDTPINFSANDVLDVAGPAAFHILSDAQTPLAVIGGLMTMTKASGGGLSLDGTNASVDLFTPVPSEPSRSTAPRRASASIPPA